MISLRPLAFLCWAGAAAPGPSAAQLSRLAVAVQEADYRGDLPRLRSLAAEMEPYLAHPNLAPRARYWRGFAHWRHALNSLNDGAPPDSVDRDFERAIEEFRAALALDPRDVEAQIGLAAGLGNRAYFNRHVPGRAGAFQTELRPVLTSLRPLAAGNPRAAFVVSATLFWSPPERGGDRPAAMALLEASARHAAAQPPAHDTLAPDWGQAELHMLLGWLSLNLAPPDLAGALGHAEAALMLRPEWRYVRDNLLPQIRRQAGQPRVRTVAYRVHEMRAMLAFYGEAFGVKFEVVESGGGIRSQFGHLAGVTLKLVPIREGADFEGFPVHQLGIEVPDVQAAIALARKHGGRVENAPVRYGGRVHAAVRDPDGNTLELYGP